MAPARAAEIMFIMILGTSLWLIRWILIQSALQLCLKWYDPKTKITLLYFLSCKNTFIFIFIFLTWRINIQCSGRQRNYRRNCYWNCIKNVALESETVAYFKVAPGYSSNPLKLKRIISERAFFIFFQTALNSFQLQNNLLTHRMFSCYQKNFFIAILALLLLY